ncbi:MAG: IS91 family transposase, partial [Chitinophagaceae bacterium]
GKNLPELIERAGRKKWNVYAKAPFGGPAQVVEYLGRYTHKIAITSHRIVKIDEHRVYFKYKDYRQQGKTREMSLSHGEFLARFEQHILPRGFVKIRHYGFLQNRNKQSRIAEIRASLNLEEAKPPVKLPVAVRMLEKFGRDIFKCPKCETGRLVLIKTTRPRTDVRIKADLKNKASPGVY